MFTLELFKDLMEINIQMCFPGYRAAVNLFVSRMPLFSCLYSIQFNLLPLPINFSRFSCDCCQILFQNKENPAIVTVNARKIYCSWWGCIYLVNVFSLSFVQKCLFCFTNSTARKVHTFSYYMSIDRISERASSSHSLRFNKCVLSTSFICLNAWLPSLSMLSYMKREIEKR